MKEMNDPIEKVLLTCLTHRPEVTLPDDFGIQMVNVVHNVRSRNSDRAFYVVAATGIVALTAMIYGLLLPINSPAARIFLQTVWQYKWTLAFFTALFLAIQYLDRHYVQVNTHGLNETV